MSKHDQHNEKQESFGSTIPASRDSTIEFSPEMPPTNSSRHKLPSRGTTEEFMGIAKAEIFKVAISLPTQGRQAQIKGIFRENGQLSKKLPPGWSKELEALRKQAREAERISHSGYTPFGLCKICNEAMTANAVRVGKTMCHSCRRKKASKAFPLLPMKSTRQAEKITESFLRDVSYQDKEETPSSDQQVQLSETGNPTPTTPEQEQEYQSLTRSTFSIPRDLSTDWLEDSRIQGSVEELAQMVLEFTAFAYNNPWPPHGLASILDVPCVKNEQAGDTTSLEPLVQTLRRILGLPGLVTVAAMITNMRIQPEHSLWISGVLGFLLEEFMTASCDSAFDDPSLYLSHLGYTPEDISRIIQDTRITILANRSSNFTSKCSTRREAFVRQLEETLLPLVGYNSEKTRDYQAMADAADELALLLSAYATTQYAFIRPDINSQYDVREHIAENEATTDNTAKQFVLLTMMAGVKAGIEGERYRICSKAKVRLWPRSEHSGVSVVIPHKRPLDQVS